MEKNVRKNRGLFSLVFCLVFACLLLPAVIVCTVKAQSNKQAEFQNNLQDTYTLGETVDLTVSGFQVEGAETLAFYSCKTIAPNGMTMDSNNLTLDQMGEYTIVYTLDNLGAQKHTVKINVKEASYYINGVGSASYGSHEYITAFNGINVSLQPGDRFVYSNVIDLSEFGAKESFFSWHCAPLTPGEREFTVFKLKVEDIYNPSNYFVIDSHCVNDAGYGPIVAYSGVSVRNETEIFYFKTSSTIIESGYPYGNGNIFSFHGTPGEGHTFNDDYLSYYFDIAQNRIFVASNEGEEYEILLDLVACGQGWEPLKTGEVKMTFWADEYEASSANMFITKIGHDDLSQKYAKDTLKPIVNVDLKSYQADALPKAKVGAGYTLFDATAYDIIDGELNVDSYVYYNYNASNQVSVMIQDGKFVPTKEGIYTIVYKSVDKSGNITKKEYEVEAVNDLEEITLTLSNQVVEAITGDHVALAMATAEGGSGICSITAQVSLNDTTYQVNDGTFIPNKEGTYKVVFTATDYCGFSETQSYDITVNYSSKPIFLETNLKDLRDVYILGYGYALPTLSAGYYSEAGELIALQPTISVDNGTVANGNYSPAQEGTVIFTYSVSINGETTSLVSETKQVVALKGEDNNFDLKNLFNYDPDIVTGQYNADGYVNYVIKQDTTLGFINELLSNDLLVTFAFNGSCANFGQMIIKLTDVNDSNKSLHITLAKVGNGLKGYCSGVSMVNLDYIFAANSVDDLQCSFKGTSVFIGEVELPVIYYENGDLFQGFPSSKVKMEIEYTDVFGSGVEVSFNNINGQIMRYVVDGIRPKIVVLEEKGGTKLINSIYKIPASIAADVISPSLKYETISVVDKDKNYVTATDGTILKDAPIKEYFIELSQYGSYRVTYRAEDLNGNKTLDNQNSFMLHVFDQTPPSISLVAGYETSAKVGQTVNVASYTQLKDNYATEVKVHIIVHSPDGKYTMLDSSTFEATTKGTYTVFYYAYDDNGNFTVKKYSVKVG